MINFTESIIHTELKTNLDKLNALNKRKKKI